MRKKIAKLYVSILSDVNTRNLLFFLLLNLLFAFLELSYGLYTNSLGLISDSFHMFFDCSALIFGLAASLVVKWQPNERFSYGFGRAEVLGGMINGLFLLFIALFILKEAVERIFEPPEIHHHDRLFMVSVLGFIVNLIGIFVFQHGGQGGCSHGHSHNSHHHNHEHHHNRQHNHDNHRHHGHHDHHRNPYQSQHGHHQSQHNHDQAEYESQNHKHNSETVTLDMNGLAPSIATYVEDPYNSHYSHHMDESKSLTYDQDDVHVSKRGGSGQIMQSVFLHIVADTLGSIGVMISAVLMNQFGWLIADPICSMFIAILIAISVYPLLRSSFFILMQRIPVNLETKLPDCFKRIKRIVGVKEIYDQHFWTLNGDNYIGTFKLVVTPGSNQRQIMDNATSLLREIGVNHVNIHIEDQFRM